MYGCTKCSRVPSADCRKGKGGRGEGVDFSCILAFTTGYEEGGGVSFPERERGTLRKRWSYGLNTN